MDENYRPLRGAWCARPTRTAFSRTLFAPAETRGPLFALYAFNIEIASVRERAREPMPGEIRLQWWRDVLDGERAGEAAANPIAAALTETVARFALPKDRLTGLIEAHAFDLYDDPMPTFEALDGYLRHTVGGGLRSCGAHLRRPGGTRERAGRARLRHHGVAALVRAQRLAAPALRSGRGSGA